MAFSSFITKHLLKSKDTANDLNARKRETRGSGKKGKPLKIRMYETGTSREYDSSGLKELLKDKGIVFCSKAKKSKLVHLFNAAQHTAGRPSCMKVRLPVATLSSTEVGYDESIPKFKKFFFINKQLPQEISRHLAS